MNAPDNTLGTRIRQLRLTNGITVQQAAHNARVSITSWNNWERGFRMPALWRGAAIAQALGEPVGALFSDGTVFQVAVSEGTLQEIRDQGRERCEKAGVHIASQLEPELWKAATRPAVDVGPDARPKSRRSRKQVIAQGIAQARRGRTVREHRSIQ